MKKSATNEMIQKMSILSGLHFAINRLIEIKQKTNNEAKLTKNMR